MNNYIPNQFSNFSQPFAGDIKQKAEQLKQNEQQLEFQNVQQYVKSAQTNNFTNYSNSVEQNAKQLRLQDAKNYIQQMNSKIGLQ